jgi:hypothetical protein
METRLPTHKSVVPVYNPDIPSMPKKISNCLQNIINLVGEIFYWLSINCLSSGAGYRGSWYETPHACDSQIDEIKLEHVKYLLPTQIIQLNAQHLIDALSSDQVGCLNERHVEQIRSPLLVQKLFAHQIPFLKAEQITSLHDEKIINSLTEEQIALIHESEYARLAPALANRIPVNKIQSIGRYYLNSLPLTFIPFLTSNQLIHLVYLREIEQITETQILSLNAADIFRIESPYLLNRLKSHQVPHINPNYVDRLAVEQIPYLESHQFIRLSNPDLIRALTDDQLDQLSEAQIRSLRNTHLLKKLKPDQIPLIDPTLLDHLTVEQIPYLQTDQLINLSNRDLIAALTDDQISAIPRETVGDLRNPFLLKRLHRDQIPHVHIDCVDLLTVEQIPYLQSHQFIHLKSQALIDAITDAQICTLSQREIGSPAIPPHFVKKFQPDQIPFIHSFRINSLTEEQIPYLEPRQFIYLRQRNLIKALTDDQIKALSRREADAIRRNNLDFLNYINKNQVQYLLPSLITLITELETTSGIIWEQIQNLTADDVRNNNNTYIVQLIHKVELIQLIKDEQLVYLSDYQIPYLTPHQIQALFTSEPDEESGYSGPYPPPPAQPLHIYVRYEDGTGEWKSVRRTIAKQNMRKKLSPEQIQVISEECIRRNSKNKDLQEAINLHGTDQQKSLLQRILEAIRKALLEELEREHELRAYQRVYRLA